MRTEHAQCQWNAGLLTSREGDGEGSGPEYLRKRYGENTEQENTVLKCFVAGFTCLLIVMH